MNIKSLLGTVAVAGTLALSSVSALAFEDFTIDESVFSGGGLVTGDKLNGGYAERISFDGLGNFAVSAYANFPSLYGNDGADLQSTSLGTDYNLYALFTATGTVTNLGGGIISFDPTSANFVLYVDRNNDTTKALGATGLNPVTLGLNGDDDELASASDLTSGGGLLTPFGGFFDMVFNDFELTALGASFFVAPSPFYMTVNVDGDFDTFSATGTQTVTGDVSAVFRNVPEPSAVALLASGLIGLGFAARRRRKA